MLEINEIQRLAAMGQALRPDWPARSLRTFIERNLADRAYGDIAVALAWVATRTRTDTPRLLLEAGPWWRAAATDGSDQQPRIDWLDRCNICNYSERGCQQLNANQPDHKFLSNRDARRRTA